MSINGRMNKQSIINPYNGLLLKKKDQTTEKHKTMHESQKHYFEQKKANTEGLYYITLFI